VKNCHLLEYLTKNLHWSEDWKVWTWRRNKIVVENKKRDIVFDIWYQNDKWVIQLFKRKTDALNSLKTYTDDSWILNRERYEKTIDFVAQNYYSYPNVIKELDAVIQKVEK